MEDKRHLIESKRSIDVFCVTHFILLWSLHFDNSADHTAILLYSLFLAPSHGFQYTLHLQNTTQAFDSVLCTKLIFYIFFFYIFIYFYYSFIHVCIHCLGHFSPCSHPLECLVVNIFILNSSVWVQTLPVNKACSPSSYLVKLGAKVAMEKMRI
jgi:hypothetical protein